MSGSSVFAWRFRPALLLTTLVNWLGPRTKDEWELPPSVWGFDRDGVACNRETERSVCKKCECCQDHSSKPRIEFPPYQQKEVAVERYGKAAGRLNSKIPSIFDHTVLDSSTIESYYQEDHGVPKSQNSF